MLVPHMIPTTFELGYAQNWDGELKHTPFPDLNLVIVCPEYSIRAFFDWVEPLYDGNGFAYIKDSQSVICMEHFLGLVELVDVPLLEDGSTFYEGGMTESYMVGSYYPFNVNAFDMFNSPIIANLPHGSWVYRWRAEQW